MREFEVFAIDSEALNRNVKVYVKLPKSYDVSDESYPVLYMHDGHVTFNDLEESDATWGLLENFIQDPTREVVLVGIDSGDTRFDELCPFEVNTKTRGKIGGKTDLYLSFIIDTVMPLINEKYRTKPEKEHTGMLGISFGGLCTIYSMTKYTNHFSRFAFVSSAFYQFYDRLESLLKDADLSDISRVYSDVGTEENEREDVKEKYVTSNKNMYALLESMLEKEIWEFHIVESSKHEFEDWNKRIPHIIDYIFS